LQVGQASQGSAQCVRSDRAGSSSATRVFFCNALTMPKKFVGIAARGQHPMQALARFVDFRREPFETSGRVHQIAQNAYLQ